MKNLLNTMDFKNIRSIDLQLSPKCNMHCRHCQQMPDKAVDASLEISDEVMIFLDNFVKFSQNPDIYNEGNKNEPACRIMFYGGEALLYWNICKKIVLYFMEKYPLLSNYGLRFAVTTNGVCIDKEFVDFVNKYDVIVNFSYDAPHPFAVRDYISDDICNLVNQIHHVKIIASGSAYNFDLLTMYHCLKAKFPNAIYKPSMEINRTFTEMPFDTDNYDFDKVRVAVRKLVIGAKMNDGFCLHALRNLLITKINPETNYFHKTKSGICVAGNRLLAVTLQGSVSFCYNTFDKIGTLKDDSIESIHQKALKIWESLYDPFCLKCSARDVCHWGCGRLLRDKNNHAFNCDNFRIPFYRILKEEVQSLNMPLSVSEKEWFKQQEIEMRQEVDNFLKAGVEYAKARN